MSCWATINGKKTCLACRDAILAEAARENVAGIPGKAPWAAAFGAAVACGAAWATLSALTGSEIGFAAVGIGWAVAHATRKAAGGRRGVKLQRLARGASLLGLFLGKYFIVIHALASGAAKHGIEISPFDPRLAVIFVNHLPEWFSIYDLLWAFLAFGAVARVVGPARVAVSDARRNPAPAA